MAGELLEKFSWRMEARQECIKTQNTPEMLSEAPRRNSMVELIPVIPVWVEQTSQVFPLSPVS